MKERDQRLSAEDYKQDRGTAFEQEISLLKDQVKRILANGELELEVNKAQEAQRKTVELWSLELKEGRRFGKELETLKKTVEEAEEAAEVK